MTSSLGDFITDFWLCFFPLFIAVDPIVLLPLFISLTEGLDSGRIRSIIRQSVLTATAVALAFAFTGPPLLIFLGVTVADFMTAGGILLLVISLGDILHGEKRRLTIDPEIMGAVPLGVPLITGPAVLTTSILLVNLYGGILTSLAIVSNIMMTGLLFLFARPIARFLGIRGVKTVSKIMSLILASLAVMLIRKGLTESVRSAMG